MNANERFELMADEFYKKTGMLAPGKDYPTGFHVDSEELASKWFKFCAEYNEMVFSLHYEMIDILESVFSIEHEKGGSLGVDGSFQYKVSEDVFKKIGKLLAKARGENV